MNNRSQREFVDAVVLGLFSRFKSLALALHRQDRLETAHDFVGWLERLQENGDEVDEIALDMTLRALRTATDPLNFLILQRLYRENSVSMRALMEVTGLGRVPLHERVNALMQAGLAVQELESDDVRATPVTGGVVELVENLQEALREAIQAWLPEVT